MGKREGEEVDSTVAGGWEVWGVVLGLRGLEKKRPCRG